MNKINDINGDLSSTQKSKDINEKLAINQTVSKNRVFIQSVNPTIGQLEWEVQDEDYDYTQEVARSAYGDMLHDDERVWTLVFEIGAMQNLAKYSYQVTFFAISEPFYSEA